MNLMVFVLDQSMVCEEVFPFVPRRLLSLLPLSHSHCISPSSLMCHPLGRHTLDYALRHSSVLVLYAYAVEAE